jgi:hypothetical protein
MIQPGAALLEDYDWVGRRQEVRCALSATRHADCANLFACVPIEQGDDFERLSRHREAPREVPWSVEAG